MAKKTPKKILKDKALKTFTNAFAFNNIVVDEEGTILDYPHLLKDNNTDVFIALYFGDAGQAVIANIVVAGSIIKNGTNDDWDGNVPKTKIGKSSALIGRELLINTRITDTSRTTNNTNLTLEVGVGGNSILYRLKNKVAREGDTVSYFMRIRFIG